MEEGRPSTGAGKETPGLNGNQTHSVEGERQRCIHSSPRVNGGMRS